LLKIVLTCSVRLNLLHIILYFTYLKLQHGFITTSSLKNIFMIIFTLKKGYNPSMCLCPILKYVGIIIWNNKNIFTQTPRKIIIIFLFDFKATTTTMVIGSRH